MVLRDLGLLRLNQQQTNVPKERDNLIVFVQEKDRESKAGISLTIWTFHDLNQQPTCQYYPKNKFKKIDEVFHPMSSQKPK